MDKVNTHTANSFLSFEATGLSCHRDRLLCHLCRVPFLLGSSHFITVGFPARASRL